MAAIWDATKPATNAALLSQPVRENFVSIGEAVLVNASAKAQASPNLTVAVGAFEYLLGNGTRASYAGGNSPAMTAPTGNPRIALLTLTATSGTLGWTYGATAASPSPPACPTDSIPIVEVYCRVGMTLINNTDAGTNGYLLRHAPMLGPFIPNLAANPMTTAGDLITGGASGVAQRLGIGSDTQVLTVTSGTVGWATPTGLTNPMTAVGDLIRGGTSGVASPLAIGTANQVLTVSGGIPTWAAAVGFANPMTTAQDLIVGGASGAAGRLAVGSNTQVLTVTAGAVGWAAAVGFANPLTTAGDVFIGGASGAPSRLAAVATGQVLISQGTSSAPVWSANPAITNLLVAGGTVGTSGVGVLTFGANTVVPTSSPVDVVQITGADVDSEAGSRGLFFRDERGGTMALGTKADSTTYMKFKTITGSKTIYFDISAGGAELWADTGVPIYLTADAGGTILQVAAAGNIYMKGMGLTSQKLLGVMAADSAAVGWRYLVIQN